MIFIPQKNRPPRRGERTTGTKTKKIIENKNRLKNFQVMIRLPYKITVFSILDI